MNIGDLFTVLEFEMGFKGKQRKRVQKKDTNMKQKVGVRSSTVWSELKLS